MDEELNKLEEKSNSLIKESEDLESKLEKTQNTLAAHGKRLAQMKPESISKPFVKERIEKISQEFEDQKTSVNIKKGEVREAKIAVLLY